MNDHQNFTSLPNLNSKRIDYVIRYSIDTDENQKLKNEYVKLFFNELKNESIEVFTLEVKNKNIKSVYALLTCPIERLLAEAEKIKIEIKLKNDESIDLNTEKEVDELSFIRYLKRKFNFKDEEANNRFTQYDRVYKAWYSGIDGNNKIDPELFSVSLRGLLVDNILNNIQLYFKTSQLEKYLAQQKAKKSVKNPKKSLNEQNVQVITSDLNQEPESSNSNGLVEKIENEIKEDVIKTTELVKDLEEAFSDKIDTKYDQGIEFMLIEKYFDEAFVLHDETKQHVLLQQLLEHSNVLFVNDEDIYKNSIQKNFKTIGADGHRDKRLNLYNNWASLKNIFKFQPINAVRDYFGEEVAFYFAFVGVIITSLWVPSIIGVAFFFAGIGISVSQTSSQTSNSNYSSSTLRSGYLSPFALTFDNVLTPAYSIIICIWGMFFLEYLKRHVANLSFEWKVLDFKREEPDLPDYTRRVNETKKRLESKKNIFIKYILNKQKQLRLLFTYFVLILMILVVAFEVAIVAVFRVFIKVYAFPNNYAGQLLIGDLGSTILDAVFTATLNWSYDIIAFASTRYENNRTRQDFNNSFILKTFTFQFVNIYSNLVYVAFFRNINYNNGLFGLGTAYQDSCQGSNCMSLLSLQVLISLLITPLPSFISTVIYPLIYMFRKERKQKKIVKKVLINDTAIDMERTKENLNQKLVYLYLFNELTKPETKYLILDHFKSKIILFGYVVMFASSFYLGPMIFLIINLIDMRMTAQCLIWLFRRPVAYKTQDIGIWYTLCRFINMIGIIMNGLLLAYASNWGTANLNKSSTDRLVFFICYEHVLFTIWYLISIVIPDMSKTTQTKIKQDKLYAETVLSKAKIFNENQIEKKDNWIKDRINNETFKKNLKTDLAKLMKNPFSRETSAIESDMESIAEELESGIKVYPSGDRYEGEFLNGLKHGKGIYYWKTGAKYGGDWYKDEMTGNGTYWYYNGDSYTGSMKKGLKHGQGTLMYRNGEKYIGQFESDKKHGKGIFHYKSGDRYEGDFLNGMKHGKGTFFYKSGEKYTGDIFENKKTGQGTYTYSNGDIYEGGFYNGKLDGKGIYYSNKLEKSRAAFWSNGQEIKKEISDL